MKYTKIKKLLLVYSRKVLENNSDVFEKLKNFLRERGIIFVSVLVDDLSRDDIVNNDLILVLGGDGTFIQASHKIKDELILGMNSDSSTSEGGLMNLNENNFDKLENILDGNYSVMKRDRIDVYLDGKLINEKALNEIYFGASNQFHTSRYVLKLKEFEEEQRSSGVLVVSSTGSNAWYKSAGGNPFEELNKLKYLVREPFISRIFNSEFIGGDIEQEISFVSKMRHPTVVALDSNLIFPVEYNQEVKLKISASGLNCVFK